MQLKKSSSFEIRGGTCETLLCTVKTTDFAALKAELLQRFEATPEFFANEAVVIDVRRLEAGQRIAVSKVATLLRSVRLSPAGIVANSEQYDWANSTGLPLVQAYDQRTARAATARQEQPEPVKPVSDSASEAAAAVDNAPALPKAPASAPALLCERPLRSGQQIYAPGDLIVMGLVSHGAEIIAGGNIHVYAPLRGRALAGVHGNHQARIFCTCMEAELISIAGIYRTAENPLGPELFGKPVHVGLSGEKLVFEALKLN